MVSMQDPTSTQVAKEATMVALKHDNRLAASIGLLMASCTLLVSASPEPTEENASELFETMLKTMEDWSFRKGKEEQEHEVPRN